MILASNALLKVGEVVRMPMVSDYEGKAHYDQPMMILRVATEEEWRASHAVKIFDPVRAKELIYFYECSLD